PGYEASQWFGVGAPKNTPSQIIDKLNEAINAGLADPKIKARLAEFGGTPFVGSPADFGKLIADDSEKWGKVIRALNIRRTEADPLSIFHNVPFCECVPMTAVGHVIPAILAASGSPQERTFGQCPRPVGG